MIVDLYKHTEAIAIRLIFNETFFNEKLEIVCKLLFYCHICLIIIFLTIWIRIYFAYSLELFIDSNVIKNLMSLTIFGLKVQNNADYQIE